MNIIINKEILKELRPCTDRFKNYLEHYSDFSGSIQEFLLLSKLTYEDKIWVSRRILPVNTLRLWSVKCAESVLYIYENNYPNDRRVRDCIEATKLFLENKITKEGLAIKRHAANAAAYAADAGGAAAAAAGADTAYAYAADAADAAYAAYVAAYVAADAAYIAGGGDGRRKQQQKNIELLIESL